MNLLGSLNREFGKTIVMVTHDSRAERFVNAIYRPDKGVFAGEDPGGASLTAMQACKAAM